MLTLFDVGMKIADLLHQLEDEATFEVCVSRKSHGWRLAICKIREDGGPHHFENTVYLAASHPIQEQLPQIAISQLRSDIEKRSIQQVAIVTKAKEKMNHLATIMAGLNALQQEVADAS